MYSLKKSEVIMKNILNLFSPFGKRLSGRSGQTLVEYGLLLVLIAVVLVAAVTILGGNLGNKYNMIASTLP
jgi:pilus assembly protein Flp/PilA